MTLNYVVGPVHGHSWGHADHTCHRVTLRTQVLCLRRNSGKVWMVETGHWQHRLVRALGKNPTWFCILHLYVHVHLNSLLLWGTQWVFSASGNKYVFYVWGEILSFSRDLRSMTHKSSDGYFLKTARKRWVKSRFICRHWKRYWVIFCVFINLS